LNRYETNGNEVTYENDVAGRVESVTYPQGQKVSYGYDESNAVTDVNVSQPGWSTLNVADYQYDNMGRVTDVFWGDGGSPTSNPNLTGYRAIDHSCERICALSFLHAKTQIPSGLR